MGDERGPWIGSAWMVAAGGGAARAPRPRAVLTWVVGGTLLLGLLGGAGPHPVSAALPLPPADTSEVGATGRVPEAGLPPLPEAPPPGLLPEGSFPSGGSGAGVPETMLAAYRNSESALGATAPGCGLSWALVAGIGKVESSHAYGGAVAADGTTERPILGPQLDGTGGNASITDTDGGALDHDAVWDRAVGPTQFIPTSWRTYGADGNGDGTADPDNAFDAALATGRYLCAGGTDLTTASGRHDAVFRYNHSESYVATVLRWADAYASGALPVPDTDGGIPDPVLASGDPTLAALPAPVPTTGGGAVPPGTGLLGGSPVPPAAARSAAAPAAPGGVPAVPAPTSTGAGLVPGAPGGLAPVTPSVPGTAPAPASGVPSTTPGSTSPAPSSGTAPSAPSAPSAPVPPTGTSTTTPPVTTPGTTTPPPSSSTPSSTPTTSTPPPSSSTPSSTPSKAAVPAARLCAAAPAAVAKAFGVPAGELAAATKPGPQPGQVTCTVTRAGKPLVVAVAATTAAAPDPAAGAGVTRRAADGRVVLSVPPSAGLSKDAATAALTTLAPAWA